MSVADIKATVRVRDKFRCVMCECTNDEHREQYGKQLEVHRLVPGSEYTVDGCITLCRPCHNEQPRSKCGYVDIKKLKLGPDMEKRVCECASLMCIKPMELVRMIVSRHLIRYEKG